MLPYPIFSGHIFNRMNATDYELEKLVTIPYFLGSYLQPIVKRLSFKNTKSYHTLFSRVISSTGLYANHAETVRELPYPIFSGHIFNRELEDSQKRLERYHTLFSRVISSTTYGHRNRGWAIGYHTLFSRVISSTGIVYSGCNVVSFVTIPYFLGSYLQQKIAYGALIAILLPYPIFSGHIFNRKNSDRDWQ